MEIKAIRNIFNTASVEYGYVDMTVINRILPEKVTPSGSGTGPDDPSQSDSQIQPSSSRNDEIPVKTEGNSHASLLFHLMTFDIPFDTI